MQKVRLRLQNMQIFCNKRGSETFSLLNCLDTTKCELLSVFSLNETIRFPLLSSTPPFLHIVLKTEFGNEG